MAHAGDRSPPAVYDSRLRRVVFASRAQHDSDLRWAIFARSVQPASAPATAPAGQWQTPASGASRSGASPAGLDWRDARRLAARQCHVDAAMRAILDLPALRDL